MFDFFLVLLLLGALVFWWDSLGAREAARQAGRRICQQNNLQFLDDTVAISRIRLRRDALGRSRIYREYRFEFSHSGDDRSGGMVTLLGKQVLKTEINLYEF